MFYQEHIYITFTISRWFYTKRLGKVYVVSNIFSILP